MEKPINDLINFSIINLDKPSGPTSFQVSQFVKNLFNINKTSHFGTLDPQVTGVLPVALGKACRLSDYFMHSDKEYVGIMRIHSEISIEELKKAANSFIGKIMQKPPVKSRVKRVIREREVKTFEILESDGKDVLFKADVQAGTYIRKLISDLGEKIGGAHMLELRRTRASIFSEDNETFSSLYSVEKYFKEYKEGKEENLRKILIPAEEAVKKALPSIEISDKNLKRVLTGKPLTSEDIQQKLEEEKFAVFADDKFIGVYRKVNEGDILARAEFVYNYSAPI